MAAYNDSYSLPRQPVPSYPISIIDIFFPGLTNISAALQQLQVGNSNGFAQMLCICVVVVFLSKYVHKHLKAFVETYFTSTAHISDTDEVYDMLIAWLSSQPFANNASSFLATAGTRKRRFAGGQSDGREKKSLQYSPWNGTFFFRYKKHFLILRSMEREDRFSSKVEISISCIGWSSKVLKDLLSECRTKYLESLKTKTSIFKHHNGDWNKSGAVDIRQPNTVIINEEKKTVLLEDIKSYLESQPWYSARGIPHRKGYLLYGPPGTGKSSLSLLIAGECDLDIYILNLSSIDDDSLDELFDNLPPRCVILLEDIDAVNATHSRQRETVTPRQDDTAEKEKPEGNVSLSALLNTIDGVGSQEGRLLIMTTNHAERLDAALLRPGRVDMKLELGLTTHEINAQLFFSIFRSNVLDKKETLENAEEVLKLKKLEVEEETELRALAADFASKVPEYEFSPAEIQLFLLGYRKSPAMAVQNVQEWVVKCREEKRRVRRADPWVSEERLRSDNDIAPSDKPTVSTTTQDDAHVEEVASTIALMKIPETAANSHCCSCQVLDDIMAICQAEAMPSVEQSLLFNHLSDLEAYRGTHADRTHSTHGFLNLLLDFAKNTYAFSAESNSTPSTTSSKHRVFDFEDATPVLSSYLHPLDFTHSDAAFSDLSPDNSSSGTLSESGSEMSSQAESNVEQVNETQESSGLEVNCQVYRHPAAPPASPELSTPAVQNGNQGNEMRHSCRLARALENTLKVRQIASV